MSNSENRTEKTKENRKDKRERYKITGSLKHGDKEYVLSTFLGKGGYSDCFLAFEKTSEKYYAAKVMSKKYLSKNQLIDPEITIHLAMDHPNIVKIIDTFETSQEIVTILELCDSDLNCYVKTKNLSEDEIKNLLIQIVHGLQYIHSKGIIHRDIKPGNILLCNNNQENNSNNNQENNSNNNQENNSQENNKQENNKAAKICDFGMAILNTSEKDICGTPNYIAPESITKDCYGNVNPSFACDIWSLGATIYFMVTGKAPFATDDVKETYSLIRRASYKYPNIKISNELKDLINRMLIVNPKERISLNDIVKHPFFTDFNNNLIETICNKISNKVSDNYLAKPLFWISKWVITKEGIFYLIDRNLYGVVSLKNNKLLFNFYTDDITYFTKINGESIKKKYKSYDNCLSSNAFFLYNLLNDNIDLLNGIDGITRSPYSLHDDIYIKKWIETKDVTYLRLSNDTFQIHFKIPNDQILISSRGNVITHIENDVQTHYLISNVSKIVLDRLETIKDFFASLIKKKDI